MEADQASPETLIRDVIVRVAAPLIDSGRAALELTPKGEYDPDSPGSLELTPANPNACRLWIGTDVLGEAYVSMGNRGTHFEIWLSKDLDHFERYVEQIVIGVIEGKYEEWVHPDEERDKAFGTFRNVPDSRILHNLLWFPRRSRDSYEHIRYERY